MYTYADFCFTFRLQTALVYIRRLSCINVYGANALGSTHTIISSDSCHIRQIQIIKKCKSCQNCRCPAKVWQIHESITLPQRTNPPTSALSPTPTRRPKLYSLQTVRKKNEYLRNTPTYFCIKSEGSGFQSIHLRLITPIRREWYRGK